MKEAISFDKKIFRPVPYPFSNGNLSNEEQNHQNYQIPRLKSKIFQRKIGDSENCDQAYSTVSLPSIEKVNFSKMNHQDYQSEFYADTIETKRPKVHLQDKIDVKAQISRKNRGVYQDKTGFLNSSKFIESQKDLNSVALAPFDKMIRIGDQSSRANNDQGNQRKASHSVLHTMVPSPSQPI